VTNLAAGLSDGPVRHEDVMVAAKRASKHFGDLLERFVQKL
jgi:purine nucleoside phosphorylase